jgi:hypothetical protein
MRFEKQGIASKNFLIYFDLLETRIENDAQQPHGAL